MAKVILITSREIVEHENRITSYEYFKYDPDGNTERWLNNYLVQFSKHWVVNIQSIRDKESEYSERIENAGGLDEALNIAKEVASKIRTNGRKTESNPFKFGIFCYELKDVIVYWAEEYPFDEKGFGEGKQRYLNSIIFEIQRDLCNKHDNIDEVEWEIFSHDKDWGRNENDFDLNPSEISVTDEFDSLKKVLKSGKITVHLFQHTVGICYSYMLKLFDKKFVSFDEFKKAAKNQIASKNKIINKTDISDEDIREFVQSYNPDFPLFETKYDANKP